MIAITAMIARALLRLFPGRFRRLHAGPLAQLLRDAARDPAAPRLFWLRVLPDLAWNAAKENMKTLRDKYFAQSTIFQSAMLAALFTVLSLMLHVTMQQILRRDANWPQIQMASDVAQRMERGANPAQLQLPQPVDLGTSLAPFTVVYDAQGLAVTQSATLGGRPVNPPPGVFSAARDHGANVLTWQPQRGTRIASVVQPVAGGAQGFVLSGRSMLVVEQNIADMGHMVLAGWAGCMTLLAVGTWIFLRLRRPVLTA